MKTKFYSLTVALFLLAGGLFAQNNVVKIKPVRLGLKQLSVEYERVIIPRLTASLNFTYQLPLELTQAEVSGVAPEFKGYSISPAVRFYPNIAKETPRGFYLEGFFKFSDHNINFSYDLDISQIVDPSAPSNSLPANQNYDLTGSINTIGGGIALGTHWLIADRFSIDWKWLGAGVYNTTVGIDLAGNLPYDPALDTPAQDFNPKWADAESLIQQDLPTDIPGVDLEVNSTDGTAGAGSVGISATTFTALPRFALTFGFAF